MWPWKRRTRFTGLDLPRKVFISHSYKDAEERQRLVALLPESVEPFVFPPITVPPEHMVSNNLLDAIRDCDGLIYLKGGASARSFWVALERDYALRQRKPVFAFDPGAQRITRDRSAPLTLKVFISYSRRDEEVARRVVDIMRQRYFEPWFDRSGIRTGDTLREETSHAIEAALKAGGYVVVLWSTSSQKSKWVTEEFGQSNLMQANRVLYALLDRTSTPPMPWYSDVQLYGDDERSMAHRVDDLIVQLYWLIYRNTRQNQLS